MSTTILTNEGWIMPDIPQDAVERLDEYAGEVWDAMADRGHDPDDGTYVAASGYRHGVLRFRCDTCGLEADANPSPWPNQIGIGGQAVATDCQ